MASFSPMAPEPCAESSTIDVYQGVKDASHNVIATIAASKADVPASVSALPVVTPTVVAGAAAAAIAIYTIKKLFDTPSRTYDQNVGDEYDNWTSDVRFFDRLDRLHAQATPSPPHHFVDSLLLTLDSWWSSRPSL